MTQQFYFRFTPKRNENIRPHKDLYTNANSNIFCNSTKWREPKCPSADELVNETWHINAVEQYSAVIGSGVLIDATIGENLQNMHSEKKTDIREHKLYDPIYKKCPEQTNPQKQKEDQWLPRG